MENKKKKLEESMYKSAKAALDALYSRRKYKVKSSKIREGLDPIDDVLDADFEAEADPKKIAPVKAGVMIKTDNKNKDLQKPKNKKDKQKLRSFLDKVRLKKKY